MISCFLEKNKLNIRRNFNYCGAVWLLVLAKRHTIRFPTLVLFPLNYWKCISLWKVVVKNLQRHAKCLAHNVCLKEMHQWCLLTGRMCCKHYPQWMFCHRGDRAGASVRAFYDRLVYRQCCQQGFFSTIKQQSSVELEH